MDKKIKVLLVDDHKLLTAGMKMLIDSWEEFEVSGIAQNGEEAVKICDENTPDVVLMDMKMPVLSGNDAAKIIKERHPGTRVVAMTAFDDSETVKNAMKNGCDGFLMKVIEPEQLRTSLHSIINGVSVMDEQALAEMKKHIDHKPGDLSQREKTILYYICKGYTNKEIAEKLSLQPGTIKNLVSLLLGKTFCVSRTDLARYAIENGIVGSGAE